ncbi:MAG: sporulation protein YqfD [Eubacteriales bacterium]|nr:sporulation protein YqfD [Eubacteriales bacterium]
MVEFQFSGGFWEDFLNDCFTQGIDVKNVALFGNGFTADCNIKTYKSLHKTAYLHGGKVKIIKKRGIPFLLKPLKNRTGFFVGIIAFVFIICFLEGFVWNVEIVGNERISRSVLTSYLENSGLKSGTMWSVIDRKELAWDMMGDFEDIAWAHINKNGTTARVEINEITEQPEPFDENTLKGNKVQRKELEVVAYRQQSKISLRSQKTYRRLIFFSAEIPLYIKIKAGDIEEEQAKMLTIKGTELPVGVAEKTEKYFTQTPYDLSDEELLSLAEKKLSYLVKQELDGFEIINRSPKCETDSDKCTIKCAYVVREKEE